MRTDPSTRVSDRSLGTGPTHRLVCVTTSGSLGGAETSLFTLLTALRSLEPAWRMTIIAPEEGPLLDRCRAAGIGAAIVPYPSSMAAVGESGASASLPSRLRTSLRLGFTAVTIWPYLRRLRDELRGQDPTIVHTNGIKAHVTTTLTLPDRARLVWHLHEYVRARPSTARVLRRLSKRPAVIVVNSDSVAEDARTALNEARDLRRIYNAVDVDVFRPDGPALNLAAAAHRPDGGGLVHIGLVATFARWKGHTVFLDALARLAKEDRFRAYVIGGPVYQTAGSQCSLEELQGYVAKLGLQDVVGFTGHVGDVPAALRALDIVVHASTSPEPFGMVIIEAMAVGRALIAARAGGARELFEDEVDALGHEMGNADDLARQLRRLVRDRRLRESLGQAARATAVRRFSAARMAAEFREVYLGAGSCASSASSGAWRGGPASDGPQRGAGGHP